MHKYSSIYFKFIVSLQSNEVFLAAPDENGYTRIYNAESKVLSGPVVSRFGIYCHLLAGSTLQAASRQAFSYMTLAVKPGITREFHVVSIPTLNSGSFFRPISHN